MENVEHAVNMDSVVQVVAAPQGAREVQLSSGEKLGLGAQEWQTKIHEQIQRSRRVS